MNKPLRIVVPPCPTTVSHGASMRHQPEQKHKTAANPAAIPAIVVL
jgi:hypothetical protein